MAVFWVLAPCSLVEVYQRFRGPCCLHHQDDESAILDEKLVYIRNFASILYSEDARFQSKTVQTYNIEKDLGEIVLFALA
jgi:hypothetical protein